MWVRDLPDASTQSPTSLACALVSGGSTSTASLSPWMRVLDRGENIRRSPFGTGSLLSAIVSAMKTSYPRDVIVSTVIGFPESDGCGWGRGYASGYRDRTHTSDVSSIMK